MNYIGDFAEDSTVRIALTTNNGDGASVAPSSAFEAADFVIYKNGSATQKSTTNGITCTSPFDSVVGLHTLEIDTSNDTGDSGFWTTGADYWVIAIPDETVDSQTVVQVIAAFSIENRLRVKSTDQVSLAANATCTKFTDIETDTQDIQTRLPAALVSGRIDSSVGAYQTGLAPPTAAENGAAGWNRMLVDHTSTGSFGAGVAFIITTVTNILTAVNTLTSRISSGVATMFADLIQMITGSGTANAKFTTKAMEEAGGSDVYVYPMSIEQEPRNTYAKITVYTGETGSQHFFAFDSTNTALDLTGKTLEFRVADSKTKQLLYTAKTSDATLVISLGNKVEFTKSTKFTRFAHTDVTYSLRDMGAGEEVLLEGPVVVRWAP